MWRFATTLVSLTAVLAAPAVAGDMEKAYGLSKAMIEDRLQKEAPLTRELLADINEQDMVVVTGSYDHIHKVLGALELPFAQVTPAQLMAVKLKPEQTVLVNCGSHFPEAAAQKLAQFVEEGGQLITTDWALQNVIEAGFPKTIRYNKKPTADAVVRVELTAKDDPVVKGFLDEETAPQWWLEGSSYPIEILDNKVEVLIESEELGKQWGETPVLVKFNHGKGEVYHMISHLYLQRTETRNKTQEGEASGYFDAKGVSAPVAEELREQAEEDGVSYGEVQSANTSSEFLYRAIIEKKRKNKVGKDKAGENREGK